MQYRSVVSFFGAVAVVVPPRVWAQEPVTAFVDVSVIPMDRERVLGGQTVVVRGSRILALGPVKGVPVPPGAVQVDGRGKFLIPGLADMHTHTNNWPAFLAAGITTIRSPGGSPTDAMRAVRDRIAAGDLLGPRIYTAGSVDWGGAPARAAQSIEEMKAAGHDAIKVPVSAETDEVYDSILAAARRVDLKIVGHVPAKRNLEEVLGSGQWASIEHLTGYFEYAVGLSGRWSIGDAAWIRFDHRSFIDTAAWMKPTFPAKSRIRKIAAATRRAGVWNCPTLIVGYNAMLDAPDSVLARWGGPAFRATTARLFDLTLQITKALQDAGAGLLLGSDAEPGAIHRELQLLVKAGLTPYQALATGTRNVATFLGTLDSTGTVTAGKRADLVLLNGNPLADIRNTAELAGVMVGGRWLPRAEIRARLDSLAKQPS